MMERMSCLLFWNKFWKKLCRTAHFLITNTYREVRNVVAILNRKAATDRNVIAAKSGNNISNRVMGQKCYCHFKRQ